MRGKRVLAALAVTALLGSCDWVIGTGLGGEEAGTILDHRSADLEPLPRSDAKAVRDKLSVVYWHTSHGSQLRTGMDGMDAFFGGQGDYAVGGPGGLRLDDHYGPYDLGNPGLTDPAGNFETVTRTYLAAHPDTNVVLWSWCGQVSGATKEDIDLYLQKMSRLEADFPDVRFVYMTGHADGSGESGNLAIRNRQIRQFCERNGRWLFDFYDIECYDPNGSYYGSKSVNDECWYDSDGDGSRDRNWAEEWQAANPGAWWNCSSAHSLPINANRKAMAAWRLLARIAIELP